MMDLSVVIPCYNEAPHLRQNIAEIRRVLQVTRLSYEILLVDDCSTDGTREIIGELESETPDLRALLHTVNQGRGGAVTSGIHASSARFVGFLDVDLEVHPRYIPSMVSALEDGADVATAYRIYKVGRGTLVRHILSQGYRILSRAVIGHHLKDTETGFKFFRRERVLPVLDEIEDKRWFWDTEVMVRSLVHKLVIREIPCLFLRNTTKQSTVRLWQDSFTYLKNLYRFRKTGIRVE